MLKLLGVHDPVDLGSPVFVTRVSCRRSVLLLRMTPKGAKVHPSGHGSQRADGHGSVPAGSRSGSGPRLLGAVAREPPRCAGGAGAGAGPCLALARSRSAGRADDGAVSHVRANLGSPDLGRSHLRRDAGRGRHPLHRRLGGGSPDRVDGRPGLPHSAVLGWRSPTGGARVLARAPEGLVTCPALLFGVLVGVVTALVATALVATAPLYSSWPTRLRCLLVAQTMDPFGGHAGVDGGRHV